MLISRDSLSTFHIRRPIRLRFLFFFTLLCSLAFLAWHFVDAQHQIENYLQRHPFFRIPPVYQKYYDAEKQLPQHDASLPFPEGRNGRYLWVSTQMWGLGWNNIFQSYYLLALMSYLSNRAFVFRPYTWDVSSASFVQYYGKTLPSRVPLTVILSGPMAGGPFPPGLDPTPPRAVNEEYFHTVCPKDRTRIIKLSDIQNGTSGFDALQLMNAYVKVFRDEVEEGCVELRGDGHPFDWDLTGSDRLLSIWPTLSESPILANFSWSPVILSAVQTNAHLFFPALPETAHGNNDSHTSAQHVLDNSAVTPLPSLLAIHVRRGDYQTHCHHLANWSASYMGWAQHPGLLKSEAFKPPPGGGWGENTPENREIYMKHCWPTVEQIVARIGEVRRDWERGVAGNQHTETNVGGVIKAETSDSEIASDNDNNDNADGTDDSSSRSSHVHPRPPRRLTHLHIMTNANATFLDAVLDGLRSPSSTAGTWAGITSGTDLHLSEAQTHVEQIVDMAIGERAAVFIGNGFSSLTANVIMLRMVRGQPMDSNRFW